MESPCADSDGRRKRIGAKFSKKKGSKPDLVCESEEILPAKTCFVLRRSESCTYVGPTCSLLARGTTDLVLKPAAVCKTDRRMHVHVKTAVSEVESSCQRSRASLQTGQGYRQGGRMHRHALPRPASAAEKWLFPGMNTWSEKNQVIRVAQSPEHTTHHGCSNKRKECTRVVLSAVSRRRKKQCSRLEPKHP